MIPRVIHHIWLGDPMPDHLERMVATWADLHPTWEHRLWGDRDLRWLTNRSLYDEAERWAPGSEGQFRSDIARYEILQRYGGLYVDCDMEARKPVDPLCDVECFAGWETPGVWLNQAVLAAAPGLPLFDELIERLPVNVAATKGRPNVLTGPQFFTPIALTHGITCYPQANFYPYLFNQLDQGGRDFPDAYAVHHWENQRRRRGVPLASR